MTRVLAGSFIRRGFIPSGATTLTNLRCGFALFLLVSSLALAQDVPNPAVVTRPNQQLQVNGIDFVPAHSKSGPDVLAAALTAIFHNKELCCDRDSVLADRLPQSDPVSLQEVAAKLQGKQMLSDGRAIQITAEFFDAASINSGKVVHAIAENKAPLILWNRHLYIVSGVIYDDAVYSDGSEIYVIRKFLLQDPRYSDSRRDAAFDRNTDNLSTVQGFLFLNASAPQ
jgi:hypothetical protein